MKKLLFITLTAILITPYLLASDGTDASDDQVEGRWYKESYLRLGKKVFENNCAVCHGASGQGLTEDWKKPLANGNYPPPPLNGTAHTWHHSMSVLIRTIDKGGKDLGGQMPGFAGKLSDAEKFAVIAYFQNWWPQEIYDIWIQRGGLKQ